MTETDAEISPSDRRTRFRIARSKGLSSIWRSKTDGHLRFRIGALNQWYEAFVLLNFMDIVLTLFFVRHGGVEANPVGRFILENYGWPPFVSFKFIECIIFLIIVQFLYHRRRSAGRFLIMLGCAVYFILMVWDVILLLRLHH
ncbi:MAG TPA: DUF5658 family protein [Armatimonadota bacterium]|nr:DUF5658 family protein [Armatimonadota bacterium]